MQYLVIVIHIDLYLKVADFGAKLSAFAPNANKMSKCLPTFLKLCQYVLSIPYLLIYLLHIDVFK